MKTINIKLTELNNKSRKGLYIRINSPKKPTAYYKLNYGDAQIDATKKYYEDKYLKKQKKGTYQKYIKAYLEKATGTKPKKRTNIHRQAEQYLKKTKKKGELINQIKKGISQTTIKNMNNQEIKQAKINVLKPMVKDKDLLEILIKDENFNKLKNRLDYTLKGKNQNGETLIIATTHGKTLNEIKTEINNLKIKNVQKTGSETTNLNGLTNKNWEAEIKKEGTIKNWELQMNLRRGK